MNATRPVRLRSEHALSTAEGASSSAGTESNSHEGTKPQREDRIQGLPPPAYCLLAVFSLLGGFDRGYVSSGRVGNLPDAVAFLPALPAAEMARAGGSILHRPVFSQGQAPVPALPRPRACPGRATTGSRPYGTAAVWMAKNRTSLRPVCGAMPQFFSMVNLTNLAGTPAKLTTVFAV
jgi:hypothetical protein